MSAKEEVEAMRRIIAQGSYSLTPESLPYQDVAYRLAEAGFGLRRTEVPEPSGAIYDAFGTVVTRADTAFELGRQAGRSEPQGEPSEAQIEAAKEAINLRYYRTDTREFDAYAWGRLYREMAVDALRAAGGVR